MRISIQKSTGKFLEMQSAATEGTLLQNAINMGYSATDIEEREVEHAEYMAIRTAQELPRTPARNLQMEVDELKDALSQLQTKVDAAQLEVKP